MVCTPLIPALKRQRQADLRVQGQYTESFRTARATKRNPILKKTKMKRERGMGAGGGGYSKAKHLYCVYQILGSSASREKKLPVKQSLI